jgi:predicted dehydrogenase
VAAVDVVEARAEAAAGPETEVVSDYRSLFGRIDAAVVAVPTTNHLAVAQDLLERGIHVLVEKPMAASLAEADTMIAAAARGGAILAVGHTERFNPAMAAAMPVLATPRFIEVHRLSGFPERSLDVDVVFDIMIHDLDIVLAVDRSDVLAVDAIGVPVLTPRVDIANVRLRFASGCIANITASRISRDKVRKIRFFQPDRYVSVDCQAQELEVWRLQPRPGERPAIEGGKVPVEAAEPLARELADFVGAIRERRAPLVSGIEGRRALELATRVADAITMEPPTALPLT